MFRLLIVDDEKRTREGLMKCLPWKSLQIEEVAEADDGTTTLDIAKTFRPDIVLSDIRMPNMEGIEFVRRLRTIFPRCKVIFLSGYSDKEYLLSAIQLKAVSYVEKPVNIEELKKAIQDAVELCHHDSKNQRNSKLISECKPFIIQEFVLYLKDPGSTRDELEKMIQLSGLDLNIDGYYLASILKLYYNNNVPMNDIYDLKTNVQNLMNNIYAGSGITSISGAKDEASIISFINITPDTTLDKVKKALDSFTSDLFSFLNNSGYADVGFSIGVGLPVQGMDRLYESYQMAVLAEQSSFFKGNCRVLIYENPQGRIFPFSNETETEFGKLLLTENEDKVILYINRLCQQIKNYQDTLIHNVKLFFYRLLMILFDESLQRNILVWPNGTTKETIWNEVQNLNTLEQFENYIKTRIKAYFCELKEKDDLSKVVYEIIQFIKNNYRQNNLDLSSIAAHINLTPAYLCQVFKKKTGKTINEYLTDYRIEKSKELLQNTNSKLYEIATEVGYKDTKYFIRTFRKKTGITPSEFREKY